MKRYALNKYQYYNFVFQKGAYIQGFNPTYISTLDDCYNPIKKECIFTSLDRALDIQGEIYLLSNNDKQKMRDLFERHFPSTEIVNSPTEELEPSFSEQSSEESKEYHLNSWLKDEYITAIKVKGEDRSECYISWYDFDNLSELSKSYVSSYISNHSSPSLEASQNRVHYENFLRQLFSKMRENKVDDQSEMARYLLYQSVKGVIDLTPSLLKKTFLKKSVFSTGDFCKDILFWEYSPPKYRNSITETGRSDLTGWKSTDCDNFLLKQVLNWITKGSRSPKERSFSPQRGERIPKGRTDTEAPSGRGLRGE